MNDHEIIYLGPKCQEDSDADRTDSREWCIDNIWDDCDCGEKSARYVLESSALAREAALREELSASREVGVEDQLTIQNLVSERDALQQRLTDAEKRGALLSAFAKEIVDAAFEGGSLDGADIQDISVKHGLLRIENRTEECGEACACVEFGFPIECYRKTDLTALKPAEVKKPNYQSAPVVDALKEAGFLRG